MRPPSASPSGSRDHAASPAGCGDRPAPPPLATRALDRCLACGGRDLRPLALRYEFRGAFPLVRCRACGMRFLAVQPDGAALAELYSSAYFEADFRCGRSDGAAFSEEAFRDENRGLVEAFESLGPGRRLLEVGCAAGWLLRHARERGWQVRGVELSAAAVAHARGLGLEVHHGDLASARLPDGAFDLVYMGDVLEHVPDCLAALAEVSRVLAPGGHLHLRGPITTNSLARRLALAVCGLAGRTIVLREPPYHLWEFTPGSLCRLLDATGFEVVRARQSKIPPGRAHGRKSALQRAVMAAIDAVNAPLTAALNLAGDRIVVVGMKRG
jgi:SAM-dependent methyltransferase